MPRTGAAPSAATTRWSTGQLVHRRGAEAGHDERAAVVDTGRPPPVVGTGRLEQRADVAHVVGPIGDGQVERLGQVTITLAHRSSSSPKVATGGTPSSARTVASGVDRAAIPIGCSPPVSSRLAA